MDVTAAGRFVRFFRMVAVTFTHDAFRGESSAVSRRLWGRTLAMAGEGDRRRRSDHSYFSSSPRCVVAPAANAV